STASQTVTVSDDDSAGPIITLGGSIGDENDGQNQTFKWNASDVSGRGKALVATTPGDRTVFPCTDAPGDLDVSALGRGTYQINGSATDADNDSLGDALASSASHSVVVSDDDSAAPVVTLGGSTGNENDGQDQTFTWNVTDAGSGIGSVAVSITRDGTVIHTSTSAAGSFDFNSFGPGTYAISVSASDADNDRADDSLSSSDTRGVIVSDDDSDPPAIS